MSVFTIFGWFDADLFGWTVRLVHAAAVGQTAFVVLWAMLPFYRTWVGRALMVKSFSLMLYLDWAVAVYHHWLPLGHQQVIAVVLFAFIAVGIWSQMGAIVFEMRRGRTRLQPPTRRPRP
jgi:hypothetical protein